MRKILVAIAVVGLEFFLAGGLQGVHAADSVQLRTLSKEVYPMEDTILTGVEPNVLFFLDTSSSMAMAPWGQLPTVLTPINFANDVIMRDNMPLMRDGNARAKMFADCTYGAGTRPVSTTKQTPAQSEAARTLTGGLAPAPGTERTGMFDGRGFTRWGRDLANSNNIIGDPNCYYSPDPAKPYFLTFQNSAWANHTAWPSYPSGFPEGLKPYMPWGSRAGEPVPSALTSYLVPNDSKMYQMKLALWSLLEKDNAQMLSKMRIAVVGNYFDYYSKVGQAALHRRPPFSARNAAFSAWHNGAWAPIKFPYGTGPMAYSGINNDTDDAYADVENVYMAVNAAYTDTTNQTNIRHGSRAYLRVPFDYMYTASQDGIYHPTQSLVAFRELIDGVEQYHTTDTSTGMYVNDELFSGGTTQLAIPLYGRAGDHATGNTNNDVLKGKKAIDYAMGDLGSREFRRGLQVNGILMKRVENSEGLMAGTALGSVIDFFSPFGPTDGLVFTESPSGAADDTRGYFPVTGSCQSNWVVVFTGGNEVAIPGKSAIESLKNLYLGSKTMRGRQWNGDKWVGATFAMDEPIRTIFVGLLPPDLTSADGNPYDKDQAHDTGAKRLRKAITRMAHAGNPHPDGTPNTNSIPYFADNVPKLIEVLTSVLLQITSERFAAGAPVVLPPYDGGKDKVIFASSYSVKGLRQWSGAFHKYLLPEDRKMPALLIWKAEQIMASNDVNKNYRKVYTSEGTQNQFTTTIKDLRLLDDQQLSDLASIPKANAADFRNWLLHYGGEDTILGDMEHSGITIVEEPLVSEIAFRDKRIYLQTNRGVLHSIDYEEGDEKWAFIPPNIFQHRIREQKFVDGSIWYSGDGETTLRSKPLTLLDGLLSAHDTRMDGTYKTILVGNMGWGGNAFYAMDVTKAENQPVFLWAIDNARYADRETNLLDGVKRWGTAASGNINNYDYGDLGLTIAAAEVRTTEKRDVGILPGGLGYKYGRGGDTQGRVFYVFDPKDGSIIRKITQSDGFEGNGRTLGMGIVPVSYFRQKNSLKTTEFYTADSEGNLLYCGNMSDDVSGWTIKSVFQLLTVGGNDPYTGIPLTANLPVAITRALEAGRAEGKRWVFGGTSDLTVPDFTAERKLENAQQFIFGLNTDLAPSSTVTANLFPLTYMKTSPDTVPTYGKTDPEEEKTVPSDAIGWYLRLRPKIIDNTFPTDPEYVTTSPYLYSGVLYVSTFIPRTRNPNDIDKCPELGDSKLYAFDPMSGKGKWKEGQALLMRNIKISGIAALGGRLFLGVKELKGGALELLRQYDAFKGDKLRIHAERTYIEGDPATYDDKTLPGGARNVPRLQYWREEF